MSVSLKSSKSTKVTLTCGSSQANSQMKLVSLAILTGSSNLVSINHQVLRSAQGITFSTTIPTAARSWELAMLQASHRLKLQPCVRLGTKKESTPETLMQRLLASPWLSPSSALAWTLMTALEKSLKSPTSVTIKWHPGLTGNSRLIMT